jgi:hypothetical protein
MNGSSNMPNAFKGQQVAFVDSEEAMPAHAGRRSARRLLGAKGRPRRHTYRHFVVIEVQNRTACPASLTGA